MWNLVSRGSLSRNREGRGFFHRAPFSCSGCGSSLRVSLGGDSRRVWTPGGDRESRAAQLSSSSPGPRTPRSKTTRADVRESRKSSQWYAAWSGGRLEVKEAPSQPPSCNKASSRHLFPTNRPVGIKATPKLATQGGQRRSNNRCLY